jgi:hypothetical protein
MILLPAFLAKPSLSRGIALICCDTRYVEVILIIKVVEAGTERQARAH